MKKIVLGLLVMSLFVGGAFSSALAQEKKVSFSLNLGVQTNLFSESSFDKAWFTLDARFGIATGQAFEISPEVMAMVDDRFDFDAIWLYPGVMLNYISGNFFIGGGVVLNIIFWSEEIETRNLAPKINFGYRNRHLILTVYILTLTEKGMDFLQFNYIGASIGYRF